MTIRNIKAMIAVFLLVLLVCFGAVMGGQGNLSAFAATDVQTAYENTNILDNLEGSTIGGKEFDIADYPHNDNGKPQIISLVEFCYSYYADRQEDYGLYVYVYNPQDIAFDMATDRNKIQLTYGDKASYSKYTLEFLNYSEKAGYEGRFYKFKVRLSDAERLDILNTVDDNGRVYKISGIELSYKGTVTEYVCAQTYTYTGYAEGYGSELATGDTLACKVDGFDKYLTLDVHSTYYRPKGTNGEAYERDTLHSVYFSVPNETIAEYGEMTAVHATWLNARTNPIFVTGNKDVYNAVLPYIGQTVDGGDFTYAKDDNSPIPYALIASKYIESAGWNNASYSLSYMSYNANRKYTKSDTDLTDLYYCFLADNEDADAYTLPAETLIGNKADGVRGYFETYTEEHGGELINNRFSKGLFESVADSFTDITISKDDTFELTDEIISQSLWQKFVGGGYNVSGVNTYTVSAIKKVESSDFKSTAAATCEELYIDASDYDEFKEYYDEAKAKGETVYLFRYYQSDYTCYEVAEYKRGEGDWTLLGTNFGYDFVDSNAYFMQMWVQLDFDIIDLTFTKDNVDTIIPVIMSPMDIAADGAPPVITTKNHLTWWQILLAVLALILVIWLLFKFAPVLVLAVGKVIALPFKAIGAASKSLKERRKEKKEQKQEQKKRGDDNETKI